MKRTKGQALRRFQAGKHWLLSLALGLPFSHAMALGLGDIEYHSYLGEVLEAEIAVVSRNEAYSPEQIAIRQIGETEAQQVGIDLLSSRYRFQFRPFIEGGKLKIGLRTGQPVSEPFINLLVELRWPKGSVYREYTFLLDPPPVRPVASERVVSREPANNTSVRQSANTVPSVARDTTQVKAPVTSLSPGQQYRVKPGDTLYGIASAWAASSNHRRDEAMQWLFDNNPRAFLGGNINRLKAGAVITMPASTRDSLPASASTVAATRASQPVSDEPATGSETASAPAVVPAQGVVRLTNPEVMTVDDLRKMNLTDATAKAVQSHIDATREVIDKLTRDNEDMRQRLQNIEDSEYLDLLKELVIAQKEQIEELRMQARALAEGQTTSVGGSSVPVPENSDGGVRAADTETVVIESNADNSVVEIESPTARALEQSAGTVNQWLLFISALWIPAILIGLFLFWRNRSTNQEQERVAINTLLEAEEKSVARLRASAEPPADPDPSTLIDESAEMKASMEKSLEQGIDIRAEDNEFFMGGEVDDLPDDIEAPEATVAPSDYADINRELMEAFELNDDPVKQADIESRGRRPDEEVKNDIRDKTATYKPATPDFEEYYLNEPEEFEFDAESLSEDLDDIVFDTPEVDETDDIIQKALIYTTYGRYDDAESLLNKQQELVGNDPRITEALADVMELKSKDTDA